jgi:hypothetical protein
MGEQKVFAHHGFCRYCRFSIWIGYVHMNSRTNESDYGMVGGLQAMKGFLEVFGMPNPRSPIGWNLSTVVQQLIASFMIMGAFLSSFTVSA